jgi:hypothetical protein
MADVSGYRKRDAKIEPANQRTRVQAIRRAQSPNPSAHHEDWNPSPGQRLQRTYGNQALLRRNTQSSGASQPSGVGPQGGELDPALQQSILSQRGGGRAMDRDVAGAMGHHFGADMRGVRIHDDAHADSLNRSLNAKAFTLGNDVFFRQGGYQPSTQAGKGLLAHELTHVVQQGASSPRVQGKLRVGPVHDAYETEADSVATAFGGNRSPAVLRQPQGEWLRRTPRAGWIQRHDDESPLKKSEEEADKETKKVRSGAPPQVIPVESDSDDQMTTATKGSKTKAKSQDTIELSFKTLEVAFAQKSLQKTFGKLKTGKLISGEVKVVATRDELYTAQDNIEKKYNPDWVAGTCKQLAKDGGYDVNGFAEPPPDTGIYVYAGGPDPTATLHEMLHINAAVGFTGKVGRVVNEGITQRLAMKAAKEAKIDLSKAPAVYAQEREIVEKLVKIVGEKTVSNAYFNGADTLITAYDKKKGKDAYAQLKALLDGNNYDGAKILMDASPVKDGGTPPKKKGGFFSKNK